jgi:hypothetical protein
VKRKDNGFIVIDGEAHKCESWLIEAVESAGLNVPETGIDMASYDENEVATVKRILLGLPVPIKGPSPLTSGLSAASSLHGLLHEGDEDVSAEPEPPKPLPKFTELVQKKIDKIIAEEKAKLQGQEIPKEALDWANKPLPGGKSEVEDPQRQIELE